MIQMVSMPSQTFHERERSLTRRVCSRRRLNIVYCSDCILIVHCGKLYLAAWKCCGEVEGEGSCVQGTA